MEPRLKGPLSCLYCLSVTLVYCCQTVGWIKMPLRTEVGLGPGDIVLDGDPALPRKGAQQPRIFRPTLLWHGRRSQQFLSSSLKMFGDRLLSSRAGGKLFHAASETPLPVDVPLHTCATRSALRCLVCFTWIHKTESFCSFDLSWEIQFVRYCCTARLKQSLS